MITQPRDYYKFLRSVKKNGSTSFSVQEERRPPWKALQRSTNPCSPVQDPHCFTAAGWQNPCTFRWNKAFRKQPGLCSRNRPKPPTRHRTPVCKHKLENSSGSLHAAAGGAARPKGSAARQNAEHGLHCTGKKRAQQNPQNFFYFLLLRKKQTPASLQ